VEFSKRLNESSSFLPWELYSTCIKNWSILKNKRILSQTPEWDLENFATRSRSCGLRLKSGVKEWGVMDDESGESVEEEVAVAGRGNECVAAE